MTFALCLLLSIASATACHSAERGGTTSRAAVMDSLRLFPSAEDFFPEIEADFSRLRWGHAVNSQSLLQQSLLGEDMMIEADVSLGRLSTGNDSRAVPIMAHPPHTTSDLSLEEFLTTILTSPKRKGIKLDFKDIDTLQPALAMLQQHHDQITVPLWLNADIIAGPVEAGTRPLDAARFLTLVKQFFPLAVISVGWTTRFGPDITKLPPMIITDGSYSMDHVRSLADALLSAGVAQPLTFPVRAGIAASDESQTSLLWLLKQVPESTLTIWSGVYDTVNIAGLMQLINQIGKERVFIDVPAGLDCQIRHYDRGIH